MIFLVNDWYWKDKSRPLEAVQAFVRIKQETGVPLDSFTLDDGWDFDWDSATGLWGRLQPKAVSRRLGVVAGRGPPGQYRRVALVRTDRRLWYSETAGGVCAHARF